MNKKHIVILLSCLIFGLADYYVTHYPETAFAEFFRVNNTAIGMGALIVITILFFASRRKDR